MASSWKNGTAHLWRLHCHLRRTRLQTTRHFNVGQTFTLEGNFMPGAHLLHRWSQKILCCHWRQTRL